MKTAVRKIGNSLGIILGKEVTEPLELHESDEVNISVAPDGRTLVLEPIRSPHDEWKAWLDAHPKVGSEGLVMGEDEGLDSDSEDWVW